MAQIIIDLPDNAKAHAEECAAMYGYPDAAAWCKEWLVNTVKQTEKQRKQKDVAKLEKSIESQIDALYEDGTLPSDVASVITTPKVVAP